MEFSEVVRRRRMVRNYTNETVDEQSLERIVAAGLRSPSAGNTRGQSLVLVTDEGTRAAIASLAGEDAYVAAGFDPWISRAPAHLVVCVSEAAYHARYGEPDKLGADGQEIDWPVPFWWVDAGATMMLVLLAAVDEGLAAGFLGVHSIPGLRDLLEIPDDVTPIGVVTLGHPAPDRRSSSLDRLAPTGLVHRDRWGTATPEDA